MVLLLLLLLLLLVLVLVMMTMTMRARYAERSAVRQPSAERQGRHDAFWLAAPPRSSVISSLRSQ